MEIGAIGTVGSGRVDERDDLDNAGGMFMASAPVNSLYANNDVSLTEAQKNTSIFC